MGLSSLYAYTLYTELWSQKLAVVVLTASLALALWQKARDELPYLLDPAASPPARVSAADGLMAATLFFVLQGVVALIVSDTPKAVRLPDLVIAFAVAGALVYGLTRLIYWRSKTSGVPAILRGGDTARSLGWGVGLSLPAALFGIAYLAALRHSALWPAMQAVAQDGAAQRAWLFGLTVVAAPLCEEFIFRGLILGGLRRSMHATPAVLMSAAIFAVAHPPASMLPVFVLGLCTGLAYERGRTLLAPMLVHAIYNFAMLAAQLC
jgi:membrane protease YdiL (CAAX protease family)